MNQINQTLATIRRQKTIYNTILNQPNNPETQKRLKEKINTLIIEENKILKKLEDLKPCI